MILACSELCLAVRRIPRRLLSFGWMDIHPDQLCPVYTCALSFFHCGASMKTALLFFVLLIPAMIAAQNMKSTDSHSSQSIAKFSAMEDQFVKESLALSPVNASQAGYHKHLDKSGKAIRLDAQLDNVGPEGMAAQMKFYREWRDRFRKEAPVSSLNAEDAADHRLIDDQIALNLLEFETIQNYKHNPTVYVELLGNDVQSNPELKAKYEQVAPAAKRAVAEFSDWLKNDLGKRRANKRTWRL